MKSALLVLTTALTISLLMPNSAHAQLDLTPAGAVPNLAGGNMSVRINGAGNPHLCEADGTCAQLGAPLVQIDQPTDQGWGWHVRAWNTSDLPPGQLSQADGTACTDETDCWFPEGHLILLLNDQGAVLTGQYAAGEGTPLIEAVELKLLPTGRGMLSVTTRTTCGGDCVWWNWQLLAVIQSRSGYRLDAITENLRVGVRDSDTTEHHGEVWEVCVMTRRGEPVFSPDNTSITAVSGFELTDERGQLSVFELSTETQIWTSSSDTDAVAPSMLTACTPLAE